MRDQIACAHGIKTARDVMKPDVVTVVPEMTVRELMQTFLEEHVRGAPVLGPTGKVVGIVSETDVLRLVVPIAATAERCDPDRVRVADIMGPVGFVLAPGDAIERVAGIFAADGVQRVVVVENDFLVGIVTPADLMQILSAGAGEAPASAPDTRSGDRAGAHRRLTC